MFSLHDESRFLLYRADGRQLVWRRVGERFADVNFVDRVAHVEAHVNEEAKQDSLPYNDTELDEKQNTTDDGEIQRTPDLERACEVWAH